MTENKGERIAKYIAGCGVCSRRQAEKLIDQGKVSVNGEVISDMGRRIHNSDIVEVEGKKLTRQKQTKLYAYYKPLGLVTTHSDPQGRQTVFDELPDSIGRVISVGRLDLNSEGLLLLTNNGELSRHFELPATGMKRSYKVRVFGQWKEEYSTKLAQGMTVEGVNYGKVVARPEAKADGKNFWLRMTLTEGKNREIRKLLAALGMQVNRLIRVSYGEYELGKLQPGELKELTPPEEFS
jgi:23S rRNA pseudouridine2605 synthase